MIFVYQNQKKVIKVERQDLLIDFDAKLSIASVINSLAIEFPTEILVWCDQDFEPFLNKDLLNSLFHHQKMMLSYCPLDNFFSENIGFVEDSPFINVNKNVRFPTWQMSGLVGMIHSKVLLQAHSISKDIDFYFYLSSLAKILMPLGLFCYSEPKLLTNFDVKSNIKASNFLLFKFVKQNYRTRWVFLLFLNLLIYKKKFCFLPLVFSLFYEKPNTRKISLETIEVKLHNNDLRNTSCDVVIPTIGRKTYLYDVLHDLKKQTNLPKNVIIVEQNPTIDSVSELDYLQKEIWPFTIKHTFTHQAGACNARNLALKEITADYVFFADDDIRFDKDFLSKTLQQINILGTKAVSLRCFQSGQKQQLSNFFQWGSFGSGCSVVNADILKGCEFKMGYEFGFGEDSDFGMQLRNQGHDILYLPEPSILHLKAPIGGFRTKPVLAWHQDTIQPKPSPTVMLYKIKHDTKEQILGYKIILFFKFYNHQKIKNPIRYLSKFQKQWKQSIFWANELKRKIHEIFPNHLHLYATKTIAAVVAIGC